MRFTILTNPVSYDVPICTIKVPEVTSDDVANVSTFSHLVEGNRKPLWLSITAKNDNPANEYSELSRKNPFGIPDITNEVFYIPETQEETALYYSHQLIHYYYTHRTFHNETIVPYSEGITSIRLDIVTGTYLVKNSVTVLLDTGGTTEYFFDYFIDAGRLSISFWSQPPSCDRIIVRYRSIPVDLKITGQRLAVHRPEVHATNIPFLYDVNILSTSNKPLSVTFVGYDETRKTSAVVSEVTTPTEIFEFVPMNRFSGHERTYAMPYPEDRVYTVDTDNVIYVMAPPSLFYLRSKDMRSDTKLYAKTPRHVNMYYDWFPYVSHSFLVNQYGSYGFPLTDDTYGAELISETTGGSNVEKVQLNVAEPMFYRKHDGTIGGIEVVVNEQERPRVLAFDADSCAVHLERAYTQQHKLSFTYYTKERVKTQDITLNPLLPSYNGKQLSRDNVVVFLLAPQSIYPKPFSGVLPMYTDRGVLITYTYETIFTLFNHDDPATRQYARRTYIPLLPPAVANHPECVLIPLAVFYTANPLTPSSFVVEDARSAGGGLGEYTAFSFDYSTYDGEATDLSSIVYVRVKRSLVEDYALRIAEYDPDAILSEDRYLYAHTKARQLLRDYLKQYTLPGTQLEIIEE